MIYPVSSRTHLHISYLMMTDRVYPAVKGHWWWARLHLPCAESFNCQWSAQQLTLQWAASMLMVTTFSEHMRSCKRCVYPAVSVVNRHLPSGYPALKLSLAWCTQVTLQWPHSPHQVMTHCNLAYLMLTLFPHLTHDDASSHALSVQCEFDHSHSDLRNSSLQGKS